MPAARILFLFNHDAPHQVGHVGRIVRSLHEARPDLLITCATGTDAIRERVRLLVGEAAAAQVEWLDIGLPEWMDAALALPNLLAPVKRLARLRWHARRLLDTDVLVSTERTCLRLQRHLPRGWPMPRFVHVPHGAGDRAVTFHSGKAGFDRILVSGEKTARALVARGGVTPETLRVVGYAKFDAIERDKRLRLFDNDRPVFLYNPHFDPFLSSWYEEGPALLDWFASQKGQRFNLIFAPHIMLFQKKLHISPEYRRARLRSDIKPAWLEAPNILIDTDSERLTDMSYTLSADAYIGDVSSQIYEFLIRPRAAFFIDRFSQDQRSREGHYPAWEAGDVVKSAKELTGLLPDFEKRLPIYLERQKALFADTMSDDPARPASLRAALAIAEMLD